jgi:FKBP-type peptidyl-prolyl cis-trans isomerase FklB
MKLHYTLLALTGCCVAMQANAITNDQERLSYSIGINVGERLAEQELEVDPKAFAEGVNDALGKKTLRVSKEDMQKILTDFQQQQTAKMQAKQQQIAASNLKSSLDFLAGNKKEKTITTLPSGLQYQVVTEGKGKTPTTTDYVSVHYKGTLVDGTEFDNSYKRGTPANFSVQAVIPGWTEALQLMKPGAKWRLFIPPALAYGEQGAGRVIGPNSALIFDVELLNVSQKPNTDTAPATTTTTATPKSS